MRILLLISAAFLANLQDPPPKPAPNPQSGKWFGPITIRDTDSGEFLAEFSGFGDVDLEKGSGVFEQGHVLFYTKATEEKDRGHVVHLFSNRCDVDDLSRSGTRGRGQFRFTEGLRAVVDDEVRFWTSEGTFDMQTKTLRCPKSTRLVHFTWPPKVDLASALLFMDPQEMGWLRLFGAPEPDFELVGEDFEFDASSNVFTAGRKGRIRVIGSPGTALLPEKKKKKKRPDSKEPTELSCEGPLRLRNLGADDPDTWKTLHVTAERDVVIGRRSKDANLRARCDSASIYIAMPPKSQGDPQARSAVLKGGVRIDDGRGVTADADRLEWNHQDGLVRLIGAPLVEVRQGAQVLQAREVLIDKWQRVIDFKGDIVATFLSDADPSAPGVAAGSMTLKPGDLRIRTDAVGRPIAFHARNGVRISSSQTIPGRDVLEAEGTEFEWNLAAGEGALRGSPLARIRQGSNLAVAPLVTFQGASFEKSLMVLKGPKLIKFFVESRPPRNPGERALDAALGLPGLRRKPELREPTLNASASFLEASLGVRGLQGIPGRRESAMDLLVTCDGDAVFDQPANFVKLVDRCSVRAQDSTLVADRLFVHLSQTEKGPGFERVIGLGNIRALQTLGSRGGALQIDGETLELRQDPENGHRIVTVVGHPVGRGRGSGFGEFRFERFIINLDLKEFRIDEGQAPLRF